MKKHIRLFLEKTKYTRWRKGQKFKKLWREWGELQGQQQPVSHDDGDMVVVILSAAPAFLTTSKGDEAMMRAAIRTIKDANPAARIYISTASAIADRRAPELGCEGLQIFSVQSLTECFARMMSVSPNYILGIGADVMDGGYSVPFTLKMAALTDLARRSGIPASWVGFSFKGNLNPDTARIYNRLHPDVLCNLRDPVSFARFQNACSATSRLTADMAFSVQKADSPALAPYLEWADAQRAAGRRVVGVNLHAGVLPPARRGETSRLVEAYGDGLAKAMDTGKFAFLFVQHDTTPTLADKFCLAPLAKRFADRGDLFKGTADVFPPAVTKRLASALDGAVSARMHFAIAALGAGQPVLGINYQGKMEGLFQHFDFGDAVFTTPDAILSGEWQEKLMTFLENLDEHRAQVEAKLPTVQELSRSNLDHFLAYAKEAQAMPVA